MTDKLDDILDCADQAVKAWPAWMRDLDLRYPFSGPVTGTRLEGGRFVSATSEQVTTEWRITTLGVKRTADTSTA